MRCLLARAAAVALVVAVGGCGSIISIPDQGVVVLGCNSPSYCYLANCSCLRADAQPGGSCTTATVCSNPLDRSTCLCPGMFNYPVPNTDMTIPVATQCIETAQACVGRGRFCGGMGARCLPAGQACGAGGGDPPQLIASGSVGPALEPHCQFVDDVCCPGVDAGASD